MWTIGAGDHVSNQTRAEAHSRLESQELSAQNRITEEAARQQIQVVEVGQRYALFDPKSGVPGSCPRTSKPSMTSRARRRARDLPKCIKSQRQKKFRLSNTPSGRTKGKSAKEQWRLKYKLEPKKLYEDKDSISWKSNNNSCKLPTESEKRNSREMSGSLNLQKDKLNCEFNDKMKNVQSCLGLNVMKSLQKIDRTLCWIPMCKWPVRDFDLSRAATS